MVVSRMIFHTLNLFLYETNMNSENLWFNFSFLGQYCRSGLPIVPNSLFKPSISFLGILNCSCDYITIFTYIEVDAVICNATVKTIYTILDVEIANYGCRYCNFKQTLLFSFFVDFTSFILSPLFSINWWILHSSIPKQEIELNIDHQFLFPFFVCLGGDNEWFIFPYKTLIPSLSIDV